VDFGGRMKMKIILIPTCSKCPHGAQWNLDATEYMCGLKAKINYDKDKIPEYCPLGDAKDFAKKIIENASQSST
jgi:hypothetical protein